MQSSSAAASTTGWPHLSSPIVRYEGLRVGRRYRSVLICGAPSDTVLIAVSGAQACGDLPDAYRRGVVEQVRDDQDQQYGNFSSSPGLLRSGTFKIKFVGAGLFTGSTSSGVYITVK
ncbi:MAG: hypothetical protein JWN52_4456 [Actinomycetia bacterium]|nr:hypothetical protein [Actinomycetes bacterium]